MLDAFLVFARLGDSVKQTVTALGLAVSGALLLGVGLVYFETNLTAVVGSAHALSSAPPEYLEVSGRVASYNQNARLGALGLVAIPTGVALLVVSVVY